ncbi:MAG: pilin [Rudaea sp.]|nr:pilin [Rudaea sp.]
MNTSGYGLARHQTATLALLLALSATGVSAADIKSSAAENQAHAAAINSAIAGVNNVKDAIARYRLHNKDFPSSNDEAAIPPPAAFATSALKRIEVGRNGVIQATLTADSGVDDGVIIFTPAMSAQTDLNQVDWTCTTPSYSDISDITNSLCVYSKNP